MVSHATTEAMRRARFSSDEPVDSAGLDALEASSSTARSDVVMIAPERRTRQTAAGLGLTGGIITDLTDIDYGTWSGATMDELPELDILAWLTDTSTTPPGGESIDELLTRVTRWMGRVEGERRRILAVTHPAVIRAVVIRTLDAPSASFWRVDIAPLTSTTVHFRGGRWSLRSVAKKII